MKNHPESMEEAVGHRFMIDEKPYKMIEKAIRGEVAELYFLAGDVAGFAHLPCGSRQLLLRMLVHVV